MKAVLICAAAILPLLAPEAAAAFCSRPIVPYCASDGDLSDSYVSRAACREQVENHLDSLATYKTCLGQAIEQVDEEAKELRKLLSGATNGAQS